MTSKRIKQVLENGWMDFAFAFNFWAMNNYVGNLLNVLAALWLVKLMQMTWCLPLHALSMVHRNEHVDRCLIRKHSLNKTAVCRRLQQHKDLPCCLSCVLQVTCFTLKIAQFWFYNGRRVFTGCFANWQVWRRWRWKWPSFATLLFKSCTKFDKNIRSGLNVWMWAVRTWG